MIERAPWDPDEFHKVTGAGPNIPTGLDDDEPDPDAEAEQGGEAGGA